MGKVTLLASRESGNAGFNNYCSLTFRLGRSMVSGEPERQLFSPLSPPPPPKTVTNLREYAISVQ